MKTSCIFLLSFFYSFSVFSQTIVRPGGEVDPYHYHSNKAVTYGKVCVASAHPIASEVGVAVMRRGGNGFDAMIATQLALAVVYPDAGNIGGGGFLIARRHDGTEIALDFREAAPAASSRDMYLDSAGNAQTELSQNGHMSSGVPGTVAGLFATLQYAKLPFRELIQPAIDLAGKGFVITAAQAASLNRTRNAFLKYSTRPTVFVKDAPWKAGDTLVQPDLASTLERIRDNGAAGFYEGTTAALIVDEMQRGGGLVTLDDLKNYRCRERVPIAFDYRGYRIISFPPPSSGGILLAQMLKMIEKYPVASYGFQSPQCVQLMIEAERRAFADRAEYMGDPDFWKVPVDSLINDAYLSDRMKDFRPGHASHSADVKPVIIPESKETTHISIFDEEGNMVAVTTTLNNGYGSRTVVGGAGFLLNDEMDDFSIKPGVPNMYGAVGGAANAIAPGKRMLSSMTPTLVLRDGRPFMVVGTPGGTTIPTSVFQSIVNVIDFHMSAEDAVNKPKFHHQWLPDEVELEKGFPAATEAELEKMGYKCVHTYAIGRTELIKISPDSTSPIEAAADRRGDDSVSGY